MLVGMFRIMEVANFMMPDRLEITSGKIEMVLLHIKQNFKNRDVCLHDLCLLNVCVHCYLLELLAISYTRYPYSCGIIYVLMKKF